MESNDHMERLCGSQSCVNRWVTFNSKTLTDHLRY